MSLINEALKKAQRLRNDPQAQADAPPMSTGSGGVRIAKRRQARSANTMVLLGAGAVALVVLSVVATVYLLNRPSPPAAAEPNRPADTASGNAPTPSPIVNAPEIKTPPPASVAPVAVAPAGSATPASSGAIAPSASSGDPASTSATTPSETLANPPAQKPPTPIAVTPAPIPSGSATQAPAATAATAAPAATLDKPKPDERVIAFVDAIRVAGIRSSGMESRVLMNDRFYRVNDIVERTLGVRLVKVAVDSLTFSDANGVTYVKHF